MMVARVEGMLQSLIIIIINQKGKDTSLEIRTQHSRRGGSVFLNIQVMICNI
jgi:hypothetical protein